MNKSKVLETIEELPDEFTTEELIKKLKIKIETLIKLLSIYDLSETFEKGNFSPIDKLSDFAGIWENDDRTAEKLRKEAWQRG